MYIITTRIVYQYHRQLYIYIFVSGMERSGFPETPILLGFGKSYLIPETTDFDIGDGIIYKKGFNFSAKLTIR